MAITDWKVLDRAFLHGRPCPNIPHRTMEPDRRDPMTP
jgi:hypothetical protein